MVILGIIILLILLVLFLPIRYKASGNYMDNHTDIFGKVSWLIGIVSINFRYQNEQPFHIRAKVFCIPVFDNLKKHKRKKKHFRKRKEEEPQLQAASVSDHMVKQEHIEGEKLEPVYPVKDNSEPLSKETEQTEDESKDTEKKSIFQNIQNIFIKFIKFFENIKFTFQRIYVIIIKIKDNIKYYLELLQQESTKQAFGLCKKQLLRILKNLSPQKYSVKLHLGFEDPAVLGNVLAVCGMLYPLHMGRIDICPEFEQEIVEGSFSFKGRVSIYILLWTAWLFLTDKNIKKLRKQLNF